MWVNCEKTRKNLSKHFRMVSRERVILPKGEHLPGVLRSTDLGPFQLYQVAFNPLRSFGAGPSFPEK